MIIIIFKLCWKYLEQKYKQIFNLWIFKYYKLNLEDISLQNFSWMRQGLINSLTPELCAITPDLYKRNWSRKPPFQTGRLYRPPATVTQQSPMKIAHSCGLVKKFDCFLWGFTATQFFFAILINRSRDKLIILTKGN